MWCEASIAAPSKSVQDKVNKLSAVVPSAKKTVPGSRG